ncbi:MAG: protocatechuate 3,4-dioxygenase [Myxococcota bacterium]
MTTPAFRSLIEDLENLGFDRRHLLKAMGTAAVLGPLGCGTSAGVDGDPSASGGAWAVGGTGLLASTKDPFSAGLGSACAVYKASTLGPCHALTVDRADISEGLLGLPLRLELLVVDPSCAPLPGATVEIWHAGTTGLYSGSDASPMCTSGDASALSGRWFRGIQTADAKGRLRFDTLYPGWYPSRTIHIHFTVRVGATEYLTSQLFFDDSLSADILASHPSYSARGQKDTPNASDKVVTESGLVDYLLQTEQQADGTLLAWKAIVVHA